MRSLEAPLEVRKKAVGGVAVLAVVGLGVAAILFSRRGGDGEPPGNGDTGVTKPSGTIGDIILSQRGHAGFRQNVVKQPGENLTVKVTWSQNSVDFTGAPLNWPFSVFVVLAGPGVLSACDLPNCNFQLTAPGQKTTTLLIPLPTSLPAGDYRVSVGLRASESNADSSPNLSRSTVVAQVDATGVVTIGQSAPPPEFLATVTNWLSVINTEGVSGAERLIREAVSDRPDLQHITFANKGTAWDLYSAVGDSFDQRNGFNGGSLYIIPAGWVFL